MNTYIQAQKVLYCLKTRQIVYTPSPTTIYFDSKSEHECYLMLDKLFPAELWGIDIHQKLKTHVCDWKLDFCIYPKEANIQQYQQLQALCEVFNQCKISIPPTQIWIEYKGVQDKNFSEKMRKLMLSYPSLSQLIILVGSYDSAFGFYDTRSNQTYCKFIGNNVTFQKIVGSIIA